MTPIQLNREPVDAAGYGLTLDVNREGRFFAPLAISGVHDTTISVDGMGERGSSTKRT